MKGDRWKNYLITICQVIAYAVLAIPLRLLCLARRDIDPTIKRLRPGTLVVSNHQSMLDPFIVLAHLPVFLFLSLLPIRFPTAHRHMKKMRWQWLRLVGTYDIGETPRQKMVGLYRARQLLRQNITILLFPEGKVNYSGQVGELKRGIDFLLTDDRPVLFVRLKGFHRRNIHVVWDKRFITFVVVKTTDKEKYHDQIQQIFELPAVQH